MREAQAAPDSSIDSCFISSPLSPFTCSIFRSLAKNGGGGNRTRVPRSFHGSFYVRSRIIYAFRLPAPNRRGAMQTSQEQFLTSSVPDSDSKRFGFGDELLGLSD